MKCEMEIKVGLTSIMEIGNEVSELRYAFVTLAVRVIRKVFHGKVITCHFIYFLLKPHAILHLRNLSFLPFFLQEKARGAWNITLFPEIRMETVSRLFRKNEKTGE